MFSNDKDLNRYYGEILLVILGEVINVGEVGDKKEYLYIFCWCESKLV